MALAVTGCGQSHAASSTYELMQMNLCLSGLAGCYEHAVVGEAVARIRDEHPDVPMAAQPGADDEGGRGLLIVEHLSDRCGWYPLEDAKPAKVTWAVISRAGQAAGDLSAGPHPGAGRAAAARAIPVLPARHRRPSLVPAGMRGPRTVDPDILARVKVALERL